MKTKRELRELAKALLVKTTEIAIYQIGDEPERYDLSEEEEQQVLKYIEQYATAMCKAIGKEF